MIERLTPRLLLEPLSLAHAPAFQHWLADEGIARMTASFPHPYPDGEAERYITSRTAGMDPNRPTFFAVLHAGAPIGGAMLFRRAGATDGPWEIGYWIARPYWGQGYASEVVRWLVAYAFTVLDGEAVSAMVATDNPASERVLAKAGFVAVGETTGPSRARGHDVALRVWELARSVSELASFFPVTGFPVLGGDLV